MGELVYRYYGKHFDNVENTMVDVCINPIDMTDLQFARFVQLWKEHPNVNVAIKYYRQHSNKIIIMRSR